MVSNFISYSSASNSRVQKNSPKVISKPPQCFLIGTALESLFSALKLLLTVDCETAERMLMETILHKYKINVQKNFPVPSVFSNYLHFRSNNINVGSTYCSKGDCQFVFKIKSRPSAKPVALTVCRAFAQIIHCVVYHHGFVAPQ